MSYELKYLENKNINLKNMIGYGDPPQEPPITEEHLTEIGIKENIAEKILSFEKKYQGIEGIKEIFEDFYKRLFNLKDLRKDIFLYLITYLINKDKNIPFTNINILLWLVDNLSSFMLNLIKETSFISGINKDTLNIRDIGIEYIIAEYIYNIKKKTDTGTALAARDRSYKRALMSLLISEGFDINKTEIIVNTFCKKVDDRELLEMSLIIRDAINWYDLYSGDDEDKKKRFKQLIDKLEEKYKKNFVAKIDVMESAPRPGDSLTALEAFRKEFM